MEQISNVSIQGLTSEIIKEVTSEIIKREDNKSKNICRTISIHHHFFYHRLLFLYHLLYI